MRRALLRGGRQGRRSALPLQPLLPGERRSALLPRTPACSQVLFATPLHPLAASKLHLMSVASDALTNAQQTDEMTEISDGYPLLNEAPISLRRSLGADTLRQAARVEEEGCTVFLGGPYIDPDKEADSVYQPSANLRFQLFHRLNSRNWTVSLGEYRELIEAHKGVLGPHNNSAAAEIRHATDVADAVIMIVDSPGSFAEIGAFSMMESICSKMLVLSDAKYADSPGYVATGPILMSRAFGATVEYLDFGDVDSVEAVVGGYVDKNIQLRTLRQIVKR